MSKPVKTLRYDLANMTSTVKAGCYKVDVYEVSEHWLYMARKTVDHPYIAYIKAFLVPSLGLQINRWQLHEDDIPREYSFYDYYVDVGVIEVKQHEWVLRDFYLDVLVVEGKAAHILDTDEYIQGVQEGFLSSDEAEFALTRTHELINALAENSYHLESYLHHHNLSIDLGKLK
jgi:predicted RNA-binding protein associated with RNAse of E/G family